MFLWARLMVENATTATSTSELRRTLNELSSGINEAYQQVIERLDRANPRPRTFAITVLSWICCSARPTTALVSQDALSWDGELEKFSVAEILFKESVVGVCSPLVEHLEASDTLRLVYLSVQDFLCDKSQEFGSSPRADATLVRTEKIHCQVAKVCMQYLCLPSVVGVLDIDQDRFPFVDYATLFWCQQLVQSWKDQNLRRNMMQLMSVCQTL